MKGRKKYLKQLKNYCVIFSKGIRTSREMMSHYSENSTGTNKVARPD